MGDFAAAEESLAKKGISPGNVQIGFAAAVNDGRAPGDEPLILKNTAKGAHDSYDQGIDGGKVVAFNQ